MSWAPMTARLELLNATMGLGFVNSDNGSGCLFTHQPYLYSDGCDRGGCSASDGRNGDLFNEVPVFDEGLIFDKELVLNPNPAAATSLDIDIEISNYNGCMLFNCSMNCPSHAVDFMGSATFDEGPLFDEESFIDEGSIFDEVPNDPTIPCSGVFLLDGLDATTSDKELIPAFVFTVAGSSAMNTSTSNLDVDTPAICSTKCPDRAVDAVAPVVVYAITKDLVADPPYAAATFRSIVTVPGDISIDTSTMCSMIVSDVDPSSGDVVVTFLLVGSLFNEVPAPAEISPLKFLVDIELDTPLPTNHSTVCLSYVFKCVSGKQWASTHVVGDFACL